MDIKHFYIEKGSGTPMILLHGNNGDCFYFHNQTEHFSKRYRVFAIDTRGHGQTPRGSAPFTLRTFADDLFCFMNEHKINKAIIIGFSDGANIAMLFALKYPQCVEKLVLNGGNLNGDGVDDELQNKIFNEYKQLVLSCDKTPEMRKLEEMLSIMINDPDLKAHQLKDITCKVLVIAGTDDLIKREHTELIHSSLPDSRIVFINGGHLIAAENGAEFNAAVDAFLDE